GTRISENSGASMWPQLFGTKSVGGSVLPQVYVAPPVTSFAMTANPASWLPEGVSVPHVSLNRILNSYTSCPPVNAPAAASAPPQIGAHGTQIRPLPFEAIRTEVLENTPNLRSSVCGVAAPLCWVSK